MIRVRPTDAFVRSLRKLSEGRRRWIIARVRLLQSDPGDRVLRLRPFRACQGYSIIDSIRYDRIIIRREADDLYALIDCGGHEILDEWAARLNEAQ